MEGAHLPVWCKLLVENSRQGAKSRRAPLGPLHRPLQLLCELAQAQVLPRRRIDTEWREDGLGLGWAVLDGVIDESCVFEGAREADVVLGEGGLDAGGKRLARERGRGVERVRGEKRAVGREG